MNSSSNKHQAVKFDFSLAVFKKAIRLEMCREACSPNFPKMFNVKTPALNLQSKMEAKGHGLTFLMTFPGSRWVQ